MFYYSFCLYVLYLYLAENLLVCSLIGIKPKLNRYDSK